MGPGRPGIPWSTATFAPFSKAGIGDPGSTVSPHCKASGWSSTIGVSASAARLNNVAAIAKNNTQHQPVAVRVRVSFIIISCCLT
jgi:hypothetical protein